MLISCLRCLLSIVNVFYIHIIYIKGNDALLPDKITYTSLISAIVKDQEEGFADQCADLLAEMQAGSERMKPDIITYASVIHAYGIALRCDEAEALVQKMEDDDELPDPSRKRGIYEHLINAYLAKLRDSQRKRSTQRIGSNRIFVGDEVELVDKALKVLRKMENLYRQGNEAMKPTARTYSLCLQALGESSDPNCIERAEDLFERCITHCPPSSSSASSTTSGRHKNYRHPFVDAANNLASIYVKRNIENKVNKVLAVFRQMKDLGVQPTIRTYNALLGACAKLPVNSSEESKAYAIHVAVTTLKYMQDSDDPSLSPDSLSYNHVLHACNRNIDDGEERRVAMEAVFRRCCTDGCVNKIILATLNKISGDHLWSILGMDGRKGGSRYIDIQDLDPSWIRNATMDTRSTHTRTGRR